MPETITEQERLFGKRDVEYGAVTIPNAHLYPFVRVVKSLVDEARVRYDGDRLSVRSVDPANVTMVDVSVPVGSGPDDEFVVGVNIKRLSGRLQNKPRSDANSSEVLLDVAYPNTTIQVEQSFGDDVEVTFTDRLSLIDPEAIREEPDGLEMDRNGTADVPLDALLSIVNNTLEDRPIEFRAEDGKLVAGQLSEEAKYETLVEVEGVTEGTATSIYSKDYLRSTLGALDTAGVEDVELEWGDEFPMTVSFGTEYGLEGQFTMAPRIKSD